MNNFRAKQSNGDYFPGIKKYLLFYTFNSRPFKFSSNTCNGLDGN